MKRRNARGSYKWYKKESEENSMEGRGRSRRRNTHQAWKKRLSSVLAVVLTAVMILNMPLSIDGLRMHVSDAFASASNADRDSGVWATASNAKYRKGDSGDVDIYVIADDNGAVPGNTTSMTLYLKNNTDQAISEGVLTFSGRYINKEDAIFQDVGSGEEYEQIIAGGGPGQAGEESGEGLIYQESEETADETMAPDAAESIGSADEGIETTDPVLPEDSGSEGDEEEEEAYKLTNIDLLPGELHEVHFEFYTDDDVKSTKANVSFSFRGENEEGSRVTGDTKFYYSIGLPTVNFSMEDGMQIESGISNDLEIWMSEPDWVDEDLQDRLDEQEEKEEEEEEENDAADTASDSDASKASDSNASKDNTASDSNAGKDSSTSQKDEEKIQKYTEEAMEISSSRVSYTVEIYGADYSEFHPRKAEEAEDIGWISCVYEVDRNTKPGIYYGKVTATGKWNKKSFTSEQGFLFEVTGEGIQEYTEETDNVIVRASAPASVFDEEVKLVVKELREDDAQTAEKFQEAVDALEQEGTAYDGMMAVDITFVDEDGQEIEPDGEVQISIEMKKGALPEGVDLETVEIHHLKETDANTIEVEKVADGSDQTDGTVQTPEDAKAAMEEEAVPEERIEEAVSQDAEAVAAFSVDSFSTFTITWGGWDGQNNVRVQYSKKNRDGSYSEVNLRGVQSQEIDLSDIQFNFNRYTPATAIGTDDQLEYTYTQAVLVGKNERTLATYAKGTENTFRKRWNSLQYFTRSGYGGEWETVPDDSTIYLVYSTPLETFQGEDTEGIININVKNLDTDDSLRDFPFGGEGWTGNDGGVRQGIVKNKLGSSGYPVLQNNRGLTSLFADGTSANYLFQKDADGYYYYDSGRNFAQLDGNEFSLYYVPRNLDDNAPPDFPLFLPFNTLQSTTATGTNDFAGDPNRGETYEYYQLGESSADYYFGMEISFDFIMPKDGEIDGRDMVFEFEGDDDVWVFIDDVLVLDMGGVHDNYGGSINFATGAVNVDKVYEGSSGDIAGTSNTIEEMFRKAGNVWNGSDYSTHTLKFFYLERGAGGSNCSIKFNIPAIPQGTINFQKELAYSNDADAADFDFQFDAYVDYDGDGENYQLYTGSYKLFNSMNDYPSGSYTPMTAADGIIELKDGQIAQLDSTDILATSNFYIQELGVLSDKYEVKLGDTILETVYEGTGESKTEIGVKTDELMVGDNPFVTFTNSVIKGNQFNLQIEKKMEDESTPDEEFQIRILLGESETPYDGKYNLYYANGNLISEDNQASLDGIITLKAGQYAEIIGLIGGNQIRVQEVNLGNEYEEPLYTMTGPLQGNSTLPDDGGIVGVAKEGKELGTNPIKATITNHGKPGITIEKQVTGNMGEYDRAFEFTISVTHNDNPVSVDGTYGNGENAVIVENGKFSLKDDQSFTIPNLPTGSKVVVSENDYQSSGGYTTTVKIGNADADNQLSGIIEDLKISTTILFTNQKGVDVPTGIFSDHYPYLMMLAIAAIGTTGFIYPACRRRRHKGDK